MKIHSRFRDYYDHAVAFGADPSLHYVRNDRRFYPSELKNKLPEEWLYRVWWGERELCGKKLHRFIVGFCGTLYLGAKVDGEYVYSRDRLAALFPVDKSWGKYHSDRRSIRGLLSQMEPVREAHALFLEINAPLFVVEMEDPYTVRRNKDVWLTANASLREYEFAKVKDPFTAFQEIGMYLGNQLVKHDEPDEIADEYRIAMHGYDKHSFRHPIRTSALK